jgi:predicted nucleotidyltransferase
MAIETPGYTSTSHEKRFEVSKDSYSESRIRLVQRIFKEIKEKFPFDVGFSLYGSLSKGKVLKPETAEDSDIDLIVYVDSDDVAEGLDDSSVEEPDVEKQRTEAREQIRNFIRTSMQEAGLNEEAYKHIWMYDISEENIGNLFEGLEEGTRWEDSAPLRKVVRLFHLDVGGGMKKYRRAFFRHLEQQPSEYREMIWSLIVKHLKYKERRDKTDNMTDQYPETFEEASEYYGK